LRIIAPASTRASGGGIEVKTVRLYDRYSHLATPTVRVAARAGSEVMESAIDAISLSLSEWCEVTLIANGREFLIRPNVIIESVLNQKESSTK
jgi:hypothetical protein